MNETVGVVMATYNGEKYIEEQLESIINQTRRPDIIVLSDGGSTDDTLIIAEQVLANGNIEYMILKSSERLDVVSNFQKALKACEADIIFFSDQDDVWYEKKIEKLFERFKEKPETVLVFSNADIVDDNLKKIGRTLWETLHYTPEETNTIKYEMIRRNIFTGMCMAIKKKWADTLPSIPKTMLHDEFYGWCASMKNQVSFVDSPLVAYRQHFNNAVGSGKYTKFRNRKQARNKIVKSTGTTAKKYDDIEKLLSMTDEAFVQQFYVAKAFHKDRLRLYQVHGISAVIKFIADFMKGYYGKYCSKTERAFVKDMFCAVF